jgi:putative chitinase
MQQRLTAGKDMDKTVPAGAAISLDFIQLVVGRKMIKSQAANASSVVGALQRYCARFGLDQPHRLAQFLAQLLHEAGAFKYDCEIWGPTQQQKKYDNGELAKKLGNTMAGDGFLYRGRTGMQITGRANVRAFRDWCRKLMNGLVMAGSGSAALPVPDFEKNPDAMLTDPWEGLGPLWYWDSRSLNRYADQGDIEMVTKTINGGLNGYEDRLDWYAKVALVLLGYGPNDVAAFQKQAGEKADGVAGRARAPRFIARW